MLCVLKKKKVGISRFIKEVYNFGCTGVEIICCVPIISVIVSHGKICHNLKHLYIIVRHGNFRRKKGRVEHVYYSDDFINNN